MPEGKKQIYITEALHAVLKRAATQRGQSLQQLTTDLLTTAVIELDPSNLTIQAIEAARNLDAEEAVTAVTNARAVVDAILECTHCNRSAPLPILIPIPAGDPPLDVPPEDRDATLPTTEAYCSIGCAAPGAELPWVAFTALEDQVVTTADGSTGALFFRASEVGRKIARPGSCYRCGREVDPGLRINVPPKRKYCFKCLRPPDAWITEFLMPAMENMGPVQTPEEIIAALRPIGQPMSDDNA
jgi:hypothetical protein